eukprot:1704418-Pyramimonas_sp.AAC.1
MKHVFLGKIREELAAAREAPHLKLVVVARDFNITAHQAIPTVVSEAGVASANNWEASQDRAWTSLVASMPELEQLDPTLYRATQDSTAILDRVCVSLPGWM